MLIDAKADVNEVSRDSYGEVLSTPAHYACVSNNEDIIQLLQENNADFSQCAPDTIILSGNASLLDMFIKNYDLNWVGDNEYDVPLLEAIENGMYDIVERLLQLDQIDVNNIYDYQNVDPFSFACKMGDVGIAKLLVAQGYNIQENAQRTDKHGYTALLYACGAPKNAVELVKYLLSFRDENTNMPLFDLHWKAYKKENAMTFAARDCNIELIEFLLDNGAEIPLTSSWDKRTPTRTPNNSTIALLKYK